MNIKKPTEKTNAKEAKEDTWVTTKSGKKLLIKEGETAEEAWARVSSNFKPKTIKEFKNKKSIKYSDSSEAEFNYTYLKQANIKTAGGNKKISYENFFENTLANFEEVERPSGKADYKSKSGSEYWYKDGYVYRSADHWETNVATCSWYLNNKSSESRKGVKVGRSKLSDFKEKKPSFEFNKKFVEKLNIGDNYTIKLLDTNKDENTVSIKTYTGKMLKPKKSKYFKDDYEIALRGVGMSIKSNRVLEIKKPTEKTNAKELPKVYYCKHIQAGVAKYDDEMILIENDALKEMMPSMAGVPVYVDHQVVDLENIQETADGYVSDCFYNENDGWVWAKFIAVSDLAQQKIREGWSVSNAYLPTKSGDGGVWHNVDYDREILSAEYSHLAIVSNPRYEGAVIMDAVEYKKYNNELKNKIKELTNSKEEKKESVFQIIGGLKMKLFKTKQEPIENADDIMIQLENGKSVKLSEMVNAVEKEDEEKKKKEEEKVNLNSEVKVGDGMMSIKELINKYVDVVKKWEKANEVGEEKKKEEEEEEKENAEKAKKEDEEKKEEEKKNSKYVNDIKNSIKKGSLENSKVEYDSIEDKLKRGSERF